MGTDHGRQAGSGVLASPEADSPRGPGGAADGRVPSGGCAGPARLRDTRVRTDAGAAGAGRDPASTRRVYDAAGTVTGGASTGFPHGPADQRVERLTGPVPVQGTDAFVFGPDEDPVRRVERFAAEAAPGGPRAVRRERA